MTRIIVEGSNEDMLVLLELIKGTFNAEITSDTMKISKKSDVEMVKMLDGKLRKLERLFGMEEHGDEILTESVEKLLEKAKKQEEQK